MKYRCTICGYIYDDDKEKIAFNELPDDWKCPLCGAPKSAFELVEEKSTKIENTTQVEHKEVKQVVENTEDMVELSFGALSCLCSNLARGCEKQYMNDCAGKYMSLANYFASLAEPESDVSYDKLLSLVNENLNTNYPEVTDIATQEKDRGALRVKVWGEKVTMILKSLLDRYAKEGEKMLENTNVWVCTICGFIYIGQEPPKLCPVCKVQSDKFTRIGGEE